VDIDRRRLLATATCAVLTGTVCPARSLPAECGMPDVGRCHPLTRSLLDRARRSGKANRSDEEIFKIRAVSAQIGWLETSMAEAAAHAISNVELLLGSGASEASVAIDNQLMTFEAHEHGLLATWETPGALICVPRLKVYRKRHSERKRPRP
jgi:hypothetical protein